LIFFLRFFVKLRIMTKTLTVDVQRMNAERQLFAARRALEHLVKLYDNGQWKLLYKEDAFAEAVRQARQAVEHWTSIAAKSDGA
jgi:predicted P-loop ATPase